MAKCRCRPYIGRGAEPADATRYQTVYAREPGAVAAPTAGLHFDDAILAALAARGVARAFVTLHVGAGTFQPVQHRGPGPASDAQRVVHAARGDRRRPSPRRVPAAAGSLPSGTTTLRALESAALAAGGVPRGPAETALFITPGFRFAVVDRLLTNFHLPKSTLLMLVSAFAGYDAIRAAYAHAIAARYRFFSYGDALLLERDPPASPPTDAKARQVVIQKRRQLATSRIESAIQCNKTADRRRPFAAS